MITCRQLIDLIAACVDGELDETSRSDFERHLSHCPSCRAYLQTYRQTMSLTRMLATDVPLGDVPEELIEIVVARLRTEEPRSASSPPPPPDRNATRRT